MNATVVKPSRAESGAELVYEWLQGLDPRNPGAERTELLAAGVPEHTVAALYPADFSAIAPGLQAHLRTVGLSSLLKQQRALLQERKALVTLLSQVDVTPAAARRRLAGIWQSPDAIEDLKQTLYEELGGIEVKNARGISATCALMIWNVYALITHRRVMPDEQRAQLDSCACWLGIYLLKLQALEQA